MAHPEPADAHFQADRADGPHDGAPAGNAAAGFPEEKTGAAAGPETLRHYFARLLRHNGLDVAAAQQPLFGDFAAAPERASAYQAILHLQQQVMNDWKELAAIQAILQKTVQLPNAKAGKPYQFRLDPEALGLTGLAAYSLGGLEETGLEYSPETGLLSGTPERSGEFRPLFRFRLAMSGEDAPMQEKPLLLIVNADPKSLWKHLPSDVEDAYWKADSDSAVLAVGEKVAVAASKRGRSHAHEGKFRDDDFALAALTGGWALLAVADGAGSAAHSRRGSQLACAFLTDFFAVKTGAAAWKTLDDTIAATAAASSAETQKALSQQVISLLQGAAKGAHDAIAAEAREKGAALRDFSTTLLFALVKPFAFGWFVASFGVGDGAIGLYSGERGEVQLLTRPDGGEFAGQTRFLTMPEIFGAPDFYQRFAVRLVPGFTALALMTDGISDPKFGTDAALAKGEKWAAFWDDLQGANDDGAAVSFRPGNEALAAQLLSWLDFWSPGNHDDRTLLLLS